VLPSWRLRACLATKSAGSLVAATSFLEPSELQLPSLAARATPDAVLSQGALRSQPRTQPAVRKLLVHGCRGAVRSRSVSNA
jgi:hypothetical protein